jgi:hypothetical protein
MTSGGVKRLKLKQVPLDLPHDFVLLLDAFCEANRGAPRTRIIRDAVDDLVRRDLAENPGLKRRFDEALRNLKQGRFQVVSDGNTREFRNGRSPDPPGEE